MEWNEETANWFDELRLKQISGELTAVEEKELIQLTQTLENSEALLLEDYFERVTAENKALQMKLEALQEENESIAQLAIQQEQLVADARRWLTEFDQRNLQIQKKYSTLTGDVSPA